MPSKNERLFKFHIKTEINHVIWGFKIPSWKPFIIAYNVLYIIESDFLDDFLILPLMNRLFYASYLIAISFKGPLGLSRETKGDFSVSIIESYLYCYMLNI